MKEQLALLAEPEPGNFSRAARGGNLSFWGGVARIVHCRHHSEMVASYPDHESNRLSTYKLYNVLYYQSRVQLMCL